MEHVRLCSIKDFLHKNIKSFSLLGKKVGVIKKETGEFYAIEVGCKHQGADLTRGNILGSIAICPLHKWEYDLETGKCLNHDSPDLRRYDLRLEGDDIYVSLQPIY